MSYWISWFVSNLLPWLTAGVFFGGLAYRIVDWWRGPRSAVPLTVPPRQRSVARTLGEILTEITTFRRVFRGSRGLWVVSWLFHLSILVFVLGHLRLFFDFSWLWDLLRLTPEQVDLLAFIGGGTSGTIFMLGLVALFIRRLRMPVRSLSVPSDYFLLLLLLSIAITGNYMRFLMHIDLDPYRAFFSNLFKLQFGVPVQNPMFILHFLLVQVLLIYFPFSKLVHVIGGILTLKWTLRLNVPDRNGERSLA
jgi:nitrate reductase gamma subunit